MQTGKLNYGKFLKSGRVSCLAASACLFLALAWPCASPALVKQTSQPGWFVQMDQFAAGAHGSLSCKECHTEMTPDKTHPDKASKDYLKKDVTRTFDYQACQKCHKTAHERFQKGAHAEALQKEKQEGKPSETGYAPNCGDCHSAHYARSHQGRVMVGQQMTDSCGSCHPDQKASYLANYHGKAAVNLEHDKAAFCTDCHGAHTAVSLKDKTVVLNTCRRCHPDAKDAFADIIIHDSSKNLEQKSEAKISGLKIVHLLGSFSLIFVTVLLVFFYSHSGLLMLRKLQETLRRHK